MTPIFQLQEVGVTLGKTFCLQGITFSVAPGETIALIGPSGAGKSTLLKLLNGSLAPSQGQVLFLGNGLATLSGRRKRRLQAQIGTIYQQLHLVDTLPVIHNLNGGNLARWSLWQAAFSLLFPLEVQRAQQALVSVGIPEKLYERTDRLSGGQQQRVAIARVLVQDPIVILADEPIASLDPERAREVMDLLVHLCRNYQKTLIVSLHTPDFARNYCERIVGLKEGRLLFDLSRENLTADRMEELYR